LSENPLEATDNLNGEPDMLSFIVRVWKDSPSPGSENLTENWLGYVAPVQPGDRQYFTNINQIPALIATHLDKE
jgi:hypothetical protein